MASVLERGRGKVARYSVRWIDQHGDRQQTPVKAKTKGEAQKIADELERNAEQIRLGIVRAPPPPMTFAALAKAYKKTLSQHRSEKTIVGRIDNYLVAKLRDRAIQEIKPAAIDDLLREVAKSKENPEGLAPQTVRHLRNHLKVIFDYAIKKLEAMHGENPVLKADRVSVPKRMANPVDLDRLGPAFAQLEHFWVALFKTAAATGLRKCELCGLLVCDVDLESRLLHVRRSYDHDTTKTGRERFVPIPLLLVPVLRAQIANRGPNEPLFPDVNGGMIPPAKKLAVMFRNALKRSGAVVEWEHSCRRGRSGERSWGCGHRERRNNGTPEKCPRCVTTTLWVKAIPPHHTFKDLRSTFATLLYEATGDQKAAQISLGHTNEKTTGEHYVKARSKRLVALADMMPLGHALKAGGEQPSFNEGRVPQMYLSGCDPVLSGARPSGTRPQKSPVKSAPCYPVPSRANHRVGPSKPRVVGSTPAGRTVVSSGNGAVFWDGAAALELEPEQRVPQMYPADSAPEEELLTVREVAARLRVCRDTILRHIKRGDFPAIRFGSSVIRVRASDLEAFIRRSSVPTPKKGKK